MTRFPNTNERIPAGSMPAAHETTSSGHWLVLGILLVAAGLGAFAVWFQWGQTRRCLAFFGSDAADRIQNAPRVELWTLAAEGGIVRATDRLDVSQAPGLVHLRRGLIEDVNYAWAVSAPATGDAAPAASGRLTPDSWDLALAFLDQPPGGLPEAEAAGVGRSTLASATVLAFDLDGAGTATVVGQPGRVGLGRLTAALRTWASDARTKAGSEGKTGL
jgi:hypothetical protein